MNVMPARVLCVAEKPSIAKSITQILSGGQFNTRHTGCPFIKNYDFSYPQTNSFFTVTSVTGHLLDYDFNHMYAKWTSCDPFMLFDAPVETSVKKDSKPIAQNLTNEAKRAQTVMIWTDCDREGENIGAEIANICKKARSNISVNRARFSAIIHQQIHNAAQHPIQLDMSQSHAVEARILLDLRIGSAFTRLQTLSLQGRFEDLENVISYGPCQFPTLGFVVSRYNQVKSFVPEPFWYINLSVTRPSALDDSEEETVFSWRQGHLLEFNTALALYEDVLEAPTARVTKVATKDTKKWKPLPLTTVDLQKAGSRLLKISPKKVLDTAEHLYQQGFLSYPRTETDQFDPQFDFMTLIGKQTVDPVWGQFATSLQNGSFGEPRRGKKNDKAHPPIHPTAHVANLNGDEKKVYEYITRRFLACCSKDALGWETTVEVNYGGEEFYATGLTVLERNYLEVYPYDKWADRELPQFQQGEEFVPSVCELKDGHTAKPSLLTEADLVSMMDKNGIGTDATIAQHIQTIIDRNYVVERVQGSTKYLVPSKLGIGLVEGYNAIGFDRSLSKPQLRRETERRMVEICEGIKSKNDMLTESIEQYKEMFLKTKAEFDKIVNCVGNRLQGNGDIPEVDDDDMGGDDDAGGGGGRGRGRGRGVRGGRARGGQGGRGTRGARGGRGGARSGGQGGNGRGGGSDSDADDGGGGAGAAAPRARGTRARGRPRAAAAAPRKRSRRGRGGAAPESIIIVDDEDEDDKLYWNDDPSPPPPLVPVAPKRAVVPGSSSSGAGDASSSKSVPAKRKLSDNRSGPSRRCLCDKAAVLEETRIGASKGRKYWICSNNEGLKCGYFDWAEDDRVVQPMMDMMTSSTSSIDADGSASGSDKCFKCGREGHWAKSCPYDGPAAKRSKSLNNSASEKTTAEACFNCGKRGHFSNVCPNKPDGGGNACFNCGQEGHYSNACPNGRNPQSNGLIFYNSCPKNEATTSKVSSSTRGSENARARGIRRTSSGSARRGSRGGRGSKKKSSVAAADE